MIIRIVPYEIGEKENGRTVKSVALKEMQLSRGQFSSLKYKNGILLDGIPVHADKRLKKGQILSVCFEDTAHALKPEDADIRIVYEDEDFFILDKPAPLPTLSSVHQTGPTLENALYAYLGCPKNYVFRPVNRLDKGTSGLMAAAKNPYAQQLLQKKLHTGDFVREYEAVSLGVPENPEGILNFPIAKEGEGNKRTVSPVGKPAVTRYRVERAENGISLLHLQLETGRTHQIRVHLAAIHCPIAGDYLYGTADPQLPGRFALHSCFLRFTHPLTRENLSFYSPMPENIIKRFFAE